MVHFRTNFVCSRSYSPVLGKEFNALLSTVSWLTSLELGKVFDGYKYFNVIANSPHKGLSESGKATDLYRKIKELSERKERATARRRGESSHPPS